MEGSILANTAPLPWAYPPPRITQSNVTYLPHPGRSDQSSSESLPRRSNAKHSLRNTANPLKKAQGSKGVGPRDLSIPYEPSRLPQGLRLFYAKHPEMTPVAWVSTSYSLSNTDTPWKPSVPKVPLYLHNALEHEWHRHAEGFGSKKHRRTAAAAAVDKRLPMVEAFPHTTTAMAALRSAQLYHISASAIQGMFRSYKTREWVKEAKAAIVVIQSVFRVGLAKKRMAAAREMIQAGAAAAVCEAAGIAMLLLQAEPLQADLQLYTKRVLFQRWARNHRIRKAIARGFNNYILGFHKKVLQQWHFVASMATKWRRALSAMKRSRKRRLVRGCFFNLINHAEVRKACRAMAERRKQRWLRHLWRHWRITKFQENRAARLLQVKWRSCVLRWRRQAIRRLTKALTRYIQRWREHKRRRNALLRYAALLVTAPSLPVSIPTAGLPHVCGPSCVFSFCRPPPPPPPPHSIAITLQRRFRGGRMRRVFMDLRRRLLEAEALRVDRENAAALRAERIAEGAARAWLEGVEGYNAMKAEMKRVKEGYKAAKRSLRMQAKRHGEGPYRYGHDVLCGAGAWRRWCEALERHNEVRQRNEARGRAVPRAHSAKVAPAAVALVEAPPLPEPLEVGGAAATPPPLAEAPPAAAVAFADTAAAVALRPWLFPSPQLRGSQLSGYYRQVMCQGLTCDKRRG